MAVVMFEDSCRILHALYGDPDDIPAFDLPHYGTAKDHVKVLANVLASGKWSAITDAKSLGDAKIVHVALATVHPDGKGPIVEHEDQGAVCAELNSSIEEYAKWLETASPGERVEIYQHWLNVTKQVEDAFIPSPPQKQRGYGYEAKIQPRLLVDYGSSLPTTTCK
jgi:hypothetical protein